jgi:poly(3-hydroxybutyrate) depolymerase
MAPVAAGVAGIGAAAQRDSMAPNAGMVPGSSPPPAAGVAAAPTSDAPAPLAPGMASGGCAAANVPPSGPMTIDVDGTMREYIVKVPANYDPMKPYRLIFAWHGLGGSAMQVAQGFGGGYYGLESRAMGSAIFIAGQGLPANDGQPKAGTPAPPPTGASGSQARVMAVAANGGAGWPNLNGRDVAFVKKLLVWAESNYCVDTTRVFSVGMSYGGIMSNTLGCQMGDVFRAIAPMSGSGPNSFGGNKCVGHVAAWLSHGDMDDVVAFSAGQKSRDHWVMVNNCQMDTMPEGSNGCVAYQGCDPGYPVVWCQFAGGHTVPPFSSDEIWQFFSQF